MTTLEFILSLTTIAFLGLFIVSLSEIRGLARIIARHKQLEKTQDQYLIKVKSDYDTLLKQVLNLLRNSKEYRMKEVMEEFIECCTEEVEIEHYKEKFREALK
ncbi:hypothetical protein C1637_09855 [Chryseobacterium lactis]|uniref:Uncharacterized protein n=1 Tax=Chryseobacterium lactis TaxID=1241981 RepID=A0A3G6RL43_CHRLC|nr:hypothetical protein [Chryseobacterium lactis]AZA82185.1 hypothetical protein EG342_09845 [Chryseobacterium lactis]AZB02566.1 hypothetical protein EG341_00700 [Chryseobacterium lactis]PNW14139.1 hypothetical protein C1637_09855 [Chryseobacterium lactis]